MGLKSEYIYVYIYIYIYIYVDIDIDIQKQPPEVFCKKVFLDISQKLQEKTCARVLFLIKLQA